MSWAIKDLRPDLATLYGQAHAPGAQESAARRFWHAFLDAFKDWKGYAMSIKAEEPPDMNRGASASPYRIDIVVDAYERSGLKRFTLLFLEAKRAAAGLSKCEEVEAQAYRACLKHTEA